MPFDNEHPIQPQKFEPPKVDLSKEVPVKPKDNSLFGGKSLMPTRDLKFRLKKDFKSEASKYGLYSLHSSEIDRVLSKHASGIMQPYEIDQVIRGLEQELRDMSGKDFDKQKVARGVLQFFKDKKNQK